MNDSVEVADLKAQIAELKGRVDTLFTKQWIGNPASVVDPDVFTGPVFFNVGNTQVRIDNTLFSPLNIVGIVLENIATGEKKYITVTGLSSYNAAGKVITLVASDATNTYGRIGVYDGSGAGGSDGAGNRINLNGNPAQTRIQVYQGDILIQNGTAADDVIFQAGQAAASSGASGKWLLVKLGGTDYKISLDNV